MKSLAKQRGILIAFAACWSVITGAFLCVTVYGFVNQCRTLYFATTRGTIRSIAMTESNTGTDDGGPSYRIEALYSYQVNGQQYDGKRLRYAQPDTSDNWASHILTQFPKGSQQTVYYDPRSPQESVLIAGPQGQDFFMLLFLTPFTVAMLFLWGMVIQLFRRYRSMRSFGMRERGAVIRFRPTALLPVIAGVGTLGVAAFLATFAVALIGPTHPAMRTIAVAWAIIGGLAIAATILTAALRGVGRWDLLFDTKERVIIKRHLRIPYDAISGVYIGNSGKVRDQSNSFWVQVAYMLNNVPSRLNLRGLLPSFEVAQRLAGFVAVHLRKRVYGLDEKPLLGVAQKEVEERLL